MSSILWDGEIQPSLQPEKKCLENAIFSYCVHITKFSELKA